MAGLILAAARSINIRKCSLFIIIALFIALMPISVALAQTKSSVVQVTYQTVSQKTYIDKTVINPQTIIRITRLDPQTARTIVSECQKAHIDPFLILGLLKTESSFNPKATSRTGARGLGQLMTHTGRWAARREGLNFTSRSLYNPTYNAKLTVKYFSYLFKIYKGNVHRALTAYNRGEGGLKYYERRQHTAISSYSKRVLKNAKMLQQSYQKLKKS